MSKKPTNRLVVPRLYYPRRTRVTTALARSLGASRASSDIAPHLIVEARAGTGKTTTLVEGLKIVRGIPSTLTPSPQQAAVWESMALSKDAKTVCFVAFNKSIATELQNRVPAGCDAMTMHSMGLKAVTKMLGRMEINQYVVGDIIEELLGVDLRELRRTKPAVVKATEDLVSLCKMNLSHRDACGNDLSPDDEDWVEVLERLSSHYEVDLNSSKAEVFALVPRVLERCKEPKGKINFDDMIWLPVVLNLPVFKYDLLLIDERQDLNKCQMQLALTAGKRIVAVGDERQSIYGFAGADAQACASLKRLLEDTGRPVVSIPLTVTRRCGKVIVKEAQKIVPEFEAFETNPDGTITSADYPIRFHADGSREELPWEKTYMMLAQPGDMVLCRVNAPLVGNCFRFLKHGIRATIQGRDVGAGLISTIRKSKADTVAQLTIWLEDWLVKETAREQAKRNPSDSKLIALSDRVSCLMAFAEGQETTAQIVSRIESVFTDSKDAPGIRLSSIHKAKGLEARRVFLLEPKGCTVPHPMAKSPWQREQEMNLRYVAITRAIEELVFVS